MLQIAALIIFLSFPFWVVILTNLLETVYLWQVKEFRLDRVLSHYRYEGSLSLNDEFALIVRGTMVAVMVMYILSPFSAVLGIAAILAFVYYDIRALKDFSRFFHKKMHRPSLRSPRNILILLFTGVVLLLPYAYLVSLLTNLQIIPVFENIVVNNPDITTGVLIFDMPLATKVDEVTIISLPLFITIFTLCTGIIIDLILPLVVPIFVVITSPLATIRRNMIIKRAMKKMEALENMRVIAVTGSYGKTTTKEIIDQILKQKFNTIKTQKHNNTEVGIAKTILEQANSNTRIFVAEMGAYKLRETELCAQIAPPDIAIITGIDEQHMSLYGSFKNILDSTLEVVNELKPDGIVVINGDNDYCLRLAEQITYPKRLYFTNKFPTLATVKKKTGSPNDFNMYVSDVKESEKGLEFSVAFKGDREKIKTNIKARHNAGNLACAIITACELGLELKEVAEIVNSTDFELPYLTMVEGMNGAKYIDDGYNINPSGYYAGTKFLADQNVKGQKWVITQGFIELGDERENTYKKVAKETINAAKGIITTDLDLCAEIVEQKKDFNVVYVESVFDLPLFVQRDVKEGDLVLIEGPLPKQVLDKITKK